MVTKIIKNKILSHQIKWVSILVHHCNINTIAIQLSAIYTLRILKLYNNVKFIGIILIRYTI